MHNKLKHSHQPTHTDKFNHRANVTNYMSVPKRLTMHIQKHRNESQKRVTKIWHYRLSGVNIYNPPTSLSVERVGAPLQQSNQYHPAPHPCAHHLTSHLPNPTRIV